MIIRFFLALSMPITDTSFGIRIFTAFSACIAPTAIRSLVQITAVNGLPSASNFSVNTYHCIAARPKITDEEFVHNVLISMFLYGLPIAFNRDRSQISPYFTISYNDFLTILLPCITAYFIMCYTSLGRSPYFVASYIFFV